MHLHAGENKAGEMTVSAPAFPRRILFLVAGLTPQVVTETLYALCYRTPDPFLPTEIHLLTTTEGSRRARLMLLEGEQGRFYRFCEEYRLPQLAKAFDETRIHLVRGADGAPLDDIVTADDNAAVADAIMHHIRAFTSDPDCALHASVAGGRKTMSVALALAMSLFGRPQDALSHVLVSPPIRVASRLLLSAATAEGAACGHAGAAAPGKHAGSGGVAGRDSVSAAARSGGFGPAGQHWKLERGGTPRPAGSAGAETAPETAARHGAGRAAGGGGVHAANGAGIPADAGAPRLQW